jgi:hypothetical protein
MMKKLILIISGVLILASVCILSQAQSSSPSQPSSAESGGVKVYSQQGYYVNAKNSNDYACYYSFTYITKGYNNKGDIVSENTESIKDLTIEANEQRTLFTAPVDPQKNITYWITITEVWGVRKIDRRRRHGESGLTMDQRDAFKTFPNTTLDNIPLNDNLDFYGR